jgi:hypothetical protein
MLSRVLERYYGPLRLPIRPRATSFPYMRRLMPSASPNRVSSTGLNIFRNMPSLLPRKIRSADSVFRADQRRPSPSDHRVGIFNSIYEAMSGFTCVTACCFANWELTTPCYQDAAPLSYRDERIIPRAGL